jgi:hypothetical protein
MHVNQLLNAAFWQHVESWGSARHAAQVESPEHAVCSEQQWVFMHATQEDK